MSWNGKRALEILQNRRWSEGGKRRNEHMHGSVWRVCTEAYHSLALPWFALQTESAKPRLLQHQTSDPLYEKKKQKKNKILNARLHQSNPIHVLIYPTHASTAHSSPRANCEPRAQHMLLQHSQHVFPASRKRSMFEFACQWIHLVTSIHPSIHIHIIYLRAMKCTDTYWHGWLAQVSGMVRRSPTLLVWYAASELSRLIW